MSGKSFTRYKLNFTLFYLQRKPEEETPQGDNEAKKSKQEPAVNGGGGGDAAPSGNDIAEKIEEEVGS